MRILLSFENFAGFGGTETYTLTLASELERLGHDASIYSPNHGPMADRARDQGVRVLSSAQLPAECDLVIAGDTATCHELAGRYAGATIVMVVHSADHLLQAPPQTAESCDGIVVLNDRVGRAVEARAWHAPLLRLRQPLELTRYRDLGACRPAARSVLVSTNYVHGPRAQVIEQACRANGYDVKWIGATSQMVATPEQAIADADFVIGLGRTALEAMAAGRGAYVYGIVGGDGWVTPGRYAAMESDGFAGTAFSDVHIDLERMTRELAGWTETMGEYNRDLASAHHNGREHAVAMVQFARGLGTETRMPATTSEELAHLIRLQWYASARASGAEREAAGLRARLFDHEREMAALHSQLADSEARYAFLRATRRYRVAVRMAMPLDRWRAARASRNGAPTAEA